MLHGPGISNAIGFSWQLRLHLYQRPLLAFSERLKLCHIAPSLSCSPRILHTFRATVTWVTLTCYLLHPPVSLKSNPSPCTDSRQTLSQWSSGFTWMAVTSYYVQLPFQPSPTSTLLSRQSTLTFLVHFIHSGDRIDMFSSLFSVEDCFFGVGLMVMTFFSLCL